MPAKKKTMCCTAQPCTKSFARYQAQSSFLQESFVIGHISSWDKKFDPLIYYRLYSVNCFDSDRENPVRNRWSFTGIIFSWNGKHNGYSHREKNKNFYSFFQGWQLLIKNIFKNSALTFVM